jgi:hypothetical protein
MTTQQHPESPAIDALVHIRRVVGWAKNGVMPADKLIEQAREKLVHLQETGVMGEASAQCQAALMHLQARRLPSPEFCESAMREIDVVLMPLRNVIRTREGFEPLPADRRLGADRQQAEAVRSEARERQ